MSRATTAIADARAAGVRAQQRCDGDNLVENLVNQLRAVEELQAANSSLTCEAIDGALRRIDEARPSVSGRCMQELGYVRMYLQDAAEALGCLA